MFRKKQEEKRKSNKNQSTQLLVKGHRVGRMDVDGETGWANVIMYPNILNGLRIEEKKLKEHLLPHSYAKCLQMSSVRSSKVVHLMTLS